MEFVYRTVRSDRKTLAIEIKNDGSITVRAPRRCSDKVIEDFVLSKEKWINKHLSSLPSPTPSFSDSELAEMRERTAMLVYPRVRYYSSLMGLTPTSVKITSAKTRFGSCSSKNALCFSLYLCLCPEDAIDYVVVHELAHIKHKNHGALFHRTVEKYLPLAKEYRKLLKKRSEA